MKTHAMAATLVALGCLQMVADVAGWRKVQALAAATQVSPAMKVFTSHQGYETFSPRFSIRYTTVAGERADIALTPESYGLQGPYNRRNAYGAALAYAPVLVAGDNTRGMLNSIMRYGFCDPAPLVTELGLDGLDGTHPITIVIDPRTPVEPVRQLSFEVNCHEN